MIYKTHAELSDLINSCSIQYYTFMILLHVHVKPNPYHYKMIVSFTDGVNFKRKVEWATLDYLDLYK